MIKRYEITCKNKGCYSCGEEKKRQEAIQAAKAKEREKANEERKKKYDEEQKEWREYFGMTNSQAEEFERQKTIRIDREYNNLMKKRNKKHQNGSTDDGDKGQD